MEHFVTTIETGSTPSPGFTDGRAALVLADAANEGLRTGMTVNVVGA
jgi:myo-inositol 2-dehydrogenase/D-chiro-inositol 1-dehydrogenase